MRMIAGLMASLLISAPAFAQDCSVDLTGKPGGVSVVVEGGAPVAIWAVEPRAGIGEESPNFARPGLMLEFDVDEGALELSRVVTSVTLVSGSFVGDAPASSEVEVRSRVGGQTLKWMANRPLEAEGKMAAEMRARWPQRVELDVLHGGKVVAAAEFDLMQLDEVGRMAREGLGRCR